MNGLIPALDGVRGLAVLMVLLDHASDSEMMLLPGLDLNHAGKYGVYLFFALSAFLLTYPFFLRPASELIEWRTWGNYWLRRALRVLPLYFLVITVVNYRKRSMTNLEWWHHLTLRDGQSHFWTIPVEFKYYMVLPVLVLALGWVWRTKGWYWGLAALAVFYFVFLQRIFYPAENAWTLNHEILLSRSIYGFLAGSLAAMLHAVMVQRDYRARWIAVTAEVVGWAILAVVLLFIPSVYNLLFNAGKNTETWDDMDEFCAAAWPLFLLGVIHGQGYLRRVFEMRWLRYLGLVSYSAYLWHKLVLGKVKDMEGLGPVLGLLVFLGATVAVASISYWLVERPLSRVRLRAKPASPERGGELARVGG